MFLDQRHMDFLFYSTEANQPWIHPTRGTMWLSQHQSAQTSKSLSYSTSYTRSQSNALELSYKGWFQVLFYYFKIDGLRMMIRALLIQNPGSFLTNPFVPQPLHIFELFSSPLFPIKLQSTNNWNHYVPFFECFCGSDKKFSGYTMFNSAMCNNLIVNKRNTQMKQISQSLTSSHLDTMDRCIYLCPGYIIYQNDSQNAVLYCHAEPHS